MPILKPKFEHTFPVSVVLTIPGGLPDPTGPLELTCRAVPPKDIAAREREILAPRPAADGEESAAAYADGADVLDLVVVSWKPFPAGVAREVAPGSVEVFPDVTYSVENMRQLLAAYPLASSEIWAAYTAAYFQARSGN